MKGRYLFTSESVGNGHPDKVCDQISDAVLDAFITNDVKLGIADDSHANTRLGCETLATTNKIVVAGEGRGQLFRDINGISVVNREEIAEIARGVVKDIGYDQNGFSYHGADVEVLLHGQSPDIAMGVDAKKKGGNLGEQEGAGDQGLMFGFACRDSEEYEKGSFMPAPIYFSHKILEVLSKARRSGELGDLQPDAKSQVTVRYVNGKAVGAINRVPSASETRSNLHVGGTAKPTKLTARDNEICEGLGPELKKRGLLFAGIDVIGPYLTEINVTSPTGIRQVKEFGGADIAALIWDAIEAKAGKS